MSSAKEKAKKLVDEFSVVGLQQRNEGKACALIAIDEIINNDGFTQFDQYLTQYWQEVKKEIELL